MARRYYRRRKRAPSTGKWFKGYMLGIIFLVLAVFTVSAINYLTSIIPESFIYANATKIGVATTVPAGTSGVSNKLIIAVLGWAVGIILFISAINRLKVRI